MPSMQTRTDQVHSWEFFLQRVVSALVAKESDPAELPFRRLGWAGIGSIMLSVLVIAGFGVYGLLVGGGATGWQDGSSIIVEKETGVSYVYRDGRLHPMANFVSAQLATGGAGITRVSAKSLADVPRGATLGIPGAPASLPGNGNLLAGAWSVCTEQVPDGRGGREGVTVVGVGQVPPVGESAGDRAVLVRDPDDAGAESAGEEGDGEAPVELYLVWRGHRFPLVDEALALGALGAGRHRAVPVAPAWLDSLPVGDPLRAPAVDERGEPTDAFGELPAGQELELATGQVIAMAGVHYLVLGRELREITPLQAAMLLHDPAAAAAYPGRTPDIRTDLPAGLMATARVARLPEPSPTSPPPAAPELAELVPSDVSDGPVCAVYASGQYVPDVRTGARLPWADAAVATSLRTEQGGLLADLVLVPGGHAALVQAIGAPGAPGGAWHVVTDQGLRYTLARPDVAAQLGGDQGYDLAQRVQLPTSVLALLPAGPTLDPAWAVQPAQLYAGR